MKKKHLALIERKTISEKINQEYINFKEQSNYSETKMGIYAEFLDKEKLLVLYLYSTDKFGISKEPTARMFLNQDEYITQDLKSQNVKWRVATLRHQLLEGRCYLRGFIDDESRNVIKSYFNIEEDNKELSYIFKLQDGLLAKALERKEAKILDPIDNMMGLVPEEPADFTDWIMNEALIKSRYIFYKYSNKVNNKGFCSHCKKDVDLYKPKHNQKYVCPHCLSETILKSVGRCKHLEDKVRVCIIQDIQEIDSFVLRIFEVRKRYKEAGQKYELWSFEDKRLFYNKNLECDMYVYGNWKNRTTRWISEDIHQNGKLAVLYPNNIKDLHFARTGKMKYAKLGNMNMLRGQEYRIAMYIQAIKDEDYTAEKFINAGLHNLANFQLVNKYSNKRSSGYKSCKTMKGKSINEILGLKNDDKDILIEVNASADEWANFKKIRKETGKRLTAEQIFMLREENIDINVFSEIAKYVPINKAIKYILSHRNRKDITEIYRDYLNMSSNLKDDMKSNYILFPIDIKKKHDEAVIRHNQSKLEERININNTKYRNIELSKDNIDKCYMFENEKYIILAPKNAGEIVEEGAVLNHCVGESGYIERMNKGEIVILFLREKNNINTPFYTIEIQENFIHQCRGRKNACTTGDVKVFIEKYKKFLYKIKKKKRVAV